jgi:phosphoglycerate dehydrogenase-like enzyme
MTVTVLNAFLQPLLEQRLPDWVSPRWFATSEELLALAPKAEIGWFDSFDTGAVEAAASAAVEARWINTLAAGVEHLPLDVLRSRGTVLTNGSGLNAVTIAEYVLLGMLTVAKGYRDVVRAQDRREWLTDAPGKRELAGSRALVLGAGGIGGRVADVLRGIGVQVTEARRRGGHGVLGEEEWRGRLGDFDWVVVLVPSTPGTVGLVGSAELAAMKPGAVFMNFARGNVVDQDALVAALESGQLGGAFLDVTDPEPLPADHPLWSMDNVHISMHLSGRSQSALFGRAADRFLDNLDRWYRGEALVAQVDLTLGY